MSVISKLLIKIMVVAVACGVWTAQVQAGKIEDDIGVAQTDGLTFRWINNAGFEIRLPSGHHILIDPFLDSALMNPLPVSELERADYVLITHSHSDHASDIGLIQERFPDVRIFVGQLSAEALVREQNLDVSKVYKVSDRQIFNFGEVSIQAFAGRHTEANDGNYLVFDEHGTLSSQGWGTLELYQYLITQADGSSFMVWAGTPSIDNAYSLAGLAPDLAVVHISPKQDFSMLGHILAEMNPRVVMPHHYDLWPAILQRRPAEVDQFPAEVLPVSPENVIDRTLPYVVNQLEAGGMVAEFFQPEPHAWYHFDPSDGSISLAP